MITYSEFQPTGFDSRGAFLPDQQDWFVAPVSITRDSGPLAESNFYTALEELGGESETVEVHRFGHWGPGWFEIILIDPEDEKRAGIAEEMERILENYPVLDEMDFSEREWKEKEEIWTNFYDLGEKIELCKKAGESVFSARSETIPGRVWEYIEVDY